MGGRRFCWGKEYVLILLLSLQDAMLKTSGPRASALDKELGPWSTLSEATTACHTLPTPVLLAIPFPRSLGDLQDSFSLSLAAHH